MTTNDVKVCAFHYIYTYMVTTSNILTGCHQPGMAAGGVVVYYDN